MTLIEQAEANGRKAAEAQHRNHDIAMLRRWQQYQRNLELQNESMRGELARAYTEAYREESSYYIG
jgi:hypothetical protein